MSLIIINVVPVYKPNSILYMKQLFVIFCTLFCLSTVSAQKNYLPGNIKKNSGETVEGFIDYKGWDINPKQIKFRTSAESPVVVYTISDLISFEVTGKDKFVRADITEDMKPVNVSDLNNIPEKPSVNTTVFLRELFRNERIGLYFLKDFKYHFFVQDGNGKFDELIYQVTFSSDYSKVVNRSVFQNQLLTYFPERRSDADVVAALAKLNYIEKDLTNFFYYITNTRPKKHEKVKPVLFAGTGVAFSTMKVTGATKIADHSIKSSTSPLFFIGADFGTRRGGPALLRLQAQYYSANYQSSYLRPYGGYTAEDERYTLKMSTIKASMGLIYQFWRSDRNVAYGGMEVSGNFSSYKENVLTLRDTLAGTTRTTKDPLVFEGTWFGVHLLAGYQLNKKIDISAVGKLMGSFSNMDLIGVKPSLYEIRVGYRF